MDKNELFEKVAENELLQFLGVKIEVATPKRVVLTMPVTPKVHQYTGIMNGGVSLYLAETTASIGVNAGCDLDKVSLPGSSSSTRSRYFCSRQFLLMFHWLKLLIF